MRPVGGAVDADDVQVVRPGGQLGSHLLARVRPRVRRLEHRAVRIDELQVVVVGETHDLRAVPRAAVGGFSTGVPVWTWLLNQTVIITRYLRLTIWPRSLVVFYGVAQRLLRPLAATLAVAVFALVARTVLSRAGKRATTAPPGP